MILCGLMWNLFRHPLSDSSTHILLILNFRSNLSGVCSMVRTVRTFDLEPQTLEYLQFDFKKSTSIRN
jgi:hypothetical protein